VPEAQKLEPNWWYALKEVDGEWVAVAGKNGRCCYANMDAYDYDGTHYGWWNGVGWDDLEPVY
jgi:hypothetical protein